MTFSSTFLRAHRRGPEGAAAQAVNRGYAESVGFSGRVGARAGVAGTEGRLPARAVTGRSALIVWTELGLCTAVAVGVLLGLVTGDRGLFGWAVGSLAVACTIACWRSASARTTAPAGPMPSAI
ncbi:MAG TPA: hypothetical protein VFB17_04840 [Gaiellaceae bacterium]|nr:hypothetical protein [Gaiellaceae bacterium]